MTVHLTHIRMLTMSFIKQRYVGFRATKANIMKKSISLENQLQGHVEGNSNFFKLTKHDGGKALLSFF